MMIRSPPRITNRSAIIKYLDVDLWSWMKEVSIAFTNINFKDNFQSFIVQNLSIPAGTEVAISNEFQNIYPGIIPIGRIIIRQTGDANIIDGNTPWNEIALFLRNPSANNAVVTVLFFN